MERIKEHALSTRSDDRYNADFNIPCFHTVHYGKHSSEYFQPNLWNKLDHSDRGKSNVKSPKYSI